MAEIIAVSDLQVFEPDIDTAKAAAMITDALALAARFAPCLSTTEDAGVIAAAKAILRGALLRWSESDAGGVTTKQQTAGPFGQLEVFDNKSTKGRRFWPSEITDLQELCKTAGDSSGAFSVDTAPGCGFVNHADICSINFGADYCSCGAILTGGLYPLYEG